MARAQAEVNLGTLTAGQLPGTLSGAPVSITHAGATKRPLMHHRNRTNAFDSVIHTPHRIGMPTTAHADKAAASKPPRCAGGRLPCLFQHRWLGIDPCHHANERGKSKGKQSGPDTKVDQSVRPHKSECGRYRGEEFNQIWGPESLVEFDRGGKTVHARSSQQVRQRNSYVSDMATG
jgi:hypothetical protein